MSVFVFYRKIFKKGRKRKGFFASETECGLMNADKEILSKMQERIVTSFLDVLILSQLKGDPKGAYDIIAFIRKKFRLLISPGIVYSTLYLLERDGLIQGNFTRRRWVYTLDEKGEKTIQAFLGVNDKIRLLVVNLLSGPSE